MKRLLTCTAVGLFIGLTPALAQTEPQPSDSQTPPAVQEPNSGVPIEVLPTQPSDPSAPIEDDSDMAPRAQDIDPSSPPSSLSTEAPESTSPDQPSMSLAEDSPQFLNKQESDDMLASSLIGLSVVNANNESIGKVSDLITDADGKIAAVLIRSGDFLGIGGKDVALRYEDVKFSRDENNDITVMANLDSDTLASAPDYETLAEQEVSVGAKSDRENTQ